MTTKFNADFCAQQIQSINGKLDKLNEEILPLRKKVLWRGSKEEKESMRPYLDSLEAELKKLKAKAEYWQKLLATTAISKRTHVSYKDATAVIHSRKMLNKIAVRSNSIMNIGINAPAR
jgi:hypothetical protein